MVASALLTRAFPYSANSSLFGQNPSCAILILPRALSGASRTPQWGSCRLRCGTHFMTRQAASRQTDPAGPSRSKCRCNTMNSSRAERDDGIGSALRLLELGRSNLDGICRMPMARQFLLRCLSSATSLKAVTILLFECRGARADREGFQRRLRDALAKGSCLSV